LRPSNPVMTTFDDAVLRAMQKWPDVPSCTGWLGLDRRGRWILKDQPITHDRFIQFLNRNYTGDQNGRWFVQNGPQRVFVDLAAAPFAIRLASDGSLVTHSGVTIQRLAGVIASDQGNLYLTSEIGLGLLIDRDLARFIDQLHDTGGHRCEDRFERFILGDPGAMPLRLRWRHDEVLVRLGCEAALPAEFGFVRRPRGC
ncbi:MAG: DUF2946 family protein, partial [Gammaproteobacteria bacterium]